jgi:ribosomal protein L37E
MPLIGAKDLDFVFKRCGKKSNADSSPKKRAQNDGAGERSQSGISNRPSAIGNRQSSQSSINKEDLHFVFKRCGKKSNADSSPKKRAQNDGVGESNRVNRQSTIVNWQSAIGN